MARALVACAEELECTADEGGRRDTAEMGGESSFRPWADRALALEHAVQRRRADPEP